MEQTNTEPNRYCYSGFGVKGTVKINETRTNWTSKTYRGEWEQEIPLNALNPNFGRLRTASPFQKIVHLGMFILAAICGLLLLAAPLDYRVWLALISVLLLDRFGIRQRWNSDFIIFYYWAGGIGVSYTRKGPDAERVDAFTERLQGVIADSQR